MMRTHLIALAGIAGLLAAAQPASALTMKECSAKYQTAKQAGSTTKWNDFRKAECSADAAAPVPTPASMPVAKPAAPMQAKPMAASPTAPAQAKPAITAPAGPVPFPAAVDPKYAKETAGKARMHTCLDSYNAAKAAGTLGTTKWIEKGGGYYSACNTRLKG